MKEVPEGFPFLSAVLTIRNIGKAESDDMVPYRPLPLVNRHNPVHIYARLTQTLLLNLGEVIHLLHLELGRLHKPRGG